MKLTDEYQVATNTDGAKAPIVRRKQAKYATCRCSSTSINRRIRNPVSAVASGMHLHILIKTLRRAANVDKLTYLLERMSVHLLKNAAATHESISL
jgi:hypothetical protein